MSAQAVVQPNHDPIAVLQHIAVFCVELRGHDLAGWDARHGYALATCTRCRAKVLVSYSPLQPQLSGSAIYCQCRDWLRTPLERTMQAMVPSA